MQAILLPTRIFDLIGNVFFSVNIERHLGKRIAVRPLRAVQHAPRMKGVVSEIIKINEDNWLKVQMDEARGPFNTFTTLLIMIKEGERLRRSKSAFIFIRTFDEETMKHDFYDWGKARLID